MELGDLQVPLEGFEDVTPIPQDDGSDPVVSIAYRHNCECIYYVAELPPLHGVLLSHGTPYNTIVLLCMGFCTAETERLYLYASYDAQRSMDGMLRVAPLEFRKRIAIVRTRVRLVWGTAGGCKSDTAVGRDGKSRERPLTD